MIKGALEVVAENVVAGWMYSPEINMKDRVVLAFQGEHCIGSGQIKTFRQDLLNAGLGDGYLGFEFPITRKQALQDAIIVRLDESDLVLIQPTVLKGGARALPTKVEPEALVDRLSSLKWELTHGLITQAEFDFLRSLAQLGVFERSLMVKTSGEPRAQVGSAQPVLEECFALLMRRNVRIVAEKIPSPAKLEAQITTLAASEFPYFALTAAQAATATIAEGSHLSVDSTVPGLDRFVLQPQTLVFADARTSVSIDHALFEKSGIQLYRAVPA